MEQPEPWIAPLEVVTIVVKVTLNENLVPYAGPMPAEHPKRSTSHDLTHNFLLARNLIRAASVLFEIRRNAAIFSGYIYDRPNGSFKIRVYHKAQFIKEVTLHHLGYGGLLHVELIPHSLSSAIRFDLLDSLRVSGSALDPIGLSAG